MLQINLPDDREHSFHTAVFDYNGTIAAAAVVAVGNGVNDRAMFEAAALAIGLLLTPKRLLAALRH